MITQDDLDGRRDRKPLGISFLFFSSFLDQVDTLIVAPPKGNRANALARVGAHYQRINRRTFPRKERKINGGGRRRETGSAIYQRLQRCQHTYPQRYTLTTDYGTQRSFAAADAARILRTILEERYNGSRWFVSVRIDNADDLNRKPCSPCSALFSVAN